VESVGAFPIETHGLRRLLPSNNLTTNVSKLSRDGSIADTSSASKNHSGIGRASGSLIPLHGMVWVSFACNADFMDELKTWEHLATVEGVRRREDCDPSLDVGARD